jgi:hypothetical protein
VCVCGTWLQRLGVGADVSEGTHAGWATAAGMEAQLHPDVVAARRCTVVEMLLQLQDRLPRCVHIGHVLLGLSAHVGESSRVSGVLSVPNARRAPIPRC